MTDRCYICNRAGTSDYTVELRPYGRDGQPICFQCMDADPALTAEAERQFTKAISMGGVIVLGDGAPRPATLEETRLVETVLPGLPRSGKA
jgi:hypothetical protein